MKWTSAKMVGVLQGKVKGSGRKPSDRAEDSPVGRISQFIAARHERRANQKLGGSWHNIPVATNP